MFISFFERCNLTSYFLARFKNFAKTAIKVSTHFSCFLSFIFFCDFLRKSKVHHNLQVKTNIVVINLFCVFEKKNSHVVFFLVTDLHIHIYIYIFK